MDCAVTVLDRVDPAHRAASSTGAASLTRRLSRSQQRIHPACGARPGRARAPAHARPACRTGTRNASARERPTTPARPFRPAWRDARQARRTTRPSAHHRSGLAHLRATAGVPQLAPGGTSSGTRRPAAIASRSPALQRRNEQKNVSSQSARYHRSRRDIAALRSVIFVALWPARGARRTDVIERGAQPVLVDLQGMAGPQVQPELLHGPENQDRRSRVSALYSTTDRRRSHRSA